MTDTHTNGYEKVNENEDCIRLSDLKGSVAEKKRLNEERIIKDWMTSITREYIMEKIVEAEARDRRHAILITYETTDNTWGCLYEIYLRYRIEDKIRVFLEPSMTIATKYQSYSDGVVFMVVISWGSSSCSIL